MRDIMKAEDKNILLSILETRFKANLHRHKNVKWEDVLSKLKSSPKKLWTLNEMEKSAGEPDLVDFDKESGEYIFFDCSPESPSGRRSLCYDREAWEKRKANKPTSNVIEMADAMGAKVLDEKEYRRLQEFGAFDTRTSSWIVTPSDIRELGGALFGDFRYGKVFIYHNGADSYYASRGFRCSVRV